MMCTCRPEATYVTYGRIHYIFDRCLATDTGAGGGRGRRTVKRHVMTSAPCPSFSVRVWVRHHICRRPSSPVITYGVAPPRRIWARHHPDLRTANGWSSDNPELRGARPWPDRGRAPIESRDMARPVSELRCVGDMMLQLPQRAGWGTHARRARHPS